ncbi:DMT family transporter [Sphingomonas sp. 37zxx]|uniref:DMT family transporter n=1 Tax=Sphingomonas sp. 37zxx TaxID=1550073 RepID=UPI0018CC8FEE|nr:DMT family transporter [Sphingomonas sp. 37zxx]
MIWPRFASVMRAVADPAWLAIALGLFSALTLAFANMAVKMGGDILAGRAILSSSAALIVAPFALVVPLPDTATIEALAWAIPAHFAYQLCLVRAFERGDLSLVFPVMRGLAPLFTAIGGVWLLGESLHPWGWAGLLLATGAVILFALPAGRAPWREHPDGRALGWALATSVGIALYNIADANGVRVAPQPWTYIVWLFLVDWVCITFTALALRRRVLIGTVRAGWRLGVSAGALSVLSFGGALYAFSLIEAAKVAALRETSVVWAALFGARFLGEGAGRRRVIAAVVLVSGLVLLQVAG